MSNEGSGSITITYPDESPSVSLISYSADTLVSHDHREVNQVVDTSTSFDNDGRFLKAGELTFLHLQDHPAKNNYIRSSMTASTQNLPLEHGVRALTHFLLHKRGSSQDVVVTSINLVRWSKHYSSAHLTKHSDYITVTLTDHNNNILSCNNVFHSADSARTVACEFVSAANALFSAQGVSYNAFETVRVK